MRAGASPVVCVQAMPRGRVAAVLASGECVGFEHPGKVLSLYWNRPNRELLVVAMTAGNRAMVHRSCGAPCFEPFAWPGYVEMDNGNGVAVTLNDRAATVWGMDDYAKRLELEGTLEVKQGEGTVMCEYEDRLELLRADSLRTVWSLPCQTRAYDVLEQLAEDRVVMKAPDEEAVVVDPFKGTRHVMEGTGALQAGNFAFISSLLRVACFFADEAVMYGGRGERLARWAVPSGGIFTVGARDSLLYANRRDVWCFDVKKLAIRAQAVLPEDATCCDYDPDCEELLVGTAGGEVVRSTI